jgi:hypothetical protein
MELERICGWHTCLCVLTSYLYVALTAPAVGQALRLGASYIISYTSHHNYTAGISHCELTNER